MDTREVTRGSVLRQPDEEFFDNSALLVTKFLIKWTHTSYLHVSWETEKDLLELDVQVIGWLFDWVAGWLVGWVVRWLAVISSAIKL